MSDVPQHNKCHFDVPEQLNQTIGCEQDEQTDLLCDSLADMSLENRHLVQELITIFPDVAKNLDVSGKLHDWGKALTIIKDNKLPLDNIAHELFFDVVQCYDLDHLGMVRYSPRVKQFLEHWLQVVQGEICAVHGRIQETKEMEEYMVKIIYIKYIYLFFILIIFFTQIIFNQFCILC